MVGFKTMAKERVKRPQARDPRRGGLMAIALLASAFAFHGASYASGDVREHEVVKLYPGAEVEFFGQKEFDVAKVVVGLKGLEGVLENVEGGVTRYVYVHADGTTPVQVVRNFDNALREAGFVKVVTGPDIELGGGRHDYFGAFRLDRKGRAAIHVNVAADVNGEITRSDVLIVDVAGMEQVYAVDADALYAGLQEAGRVRLDGVTFDTGKATLRPESRPALTEAKSLMSTHPGLKLSVEGHTDNVGAPAANQVLSLARAQAVKAWLVANGVDAERLSAAGFGDTRPQSSNTDEAGRSQNRRVELVRQ